MEPFKIHILGCGSATPTMRHLPSSQVVEIRGKLFMIDCAEGTQLQLRRTRIPFTKLQAVFISHIHGDHCLGLIGMISTFGLLGRTAPLHVYAPAELEAMLFSQIRLFCHDLGYDVIFHAVDTTVHATIFDDRSLSVETIPLKHRVPCSGYLFREKPSLPHIRRDMIDFYNIPLSQINNIKAGDDWVTDDGTVIPNSRLVRPADAPRSYAYCSDTAYLSSLANIINGVDLLYHEATYGEDGIANAEKYCHSTARQAAMVAKDSHVSRLMLGHYSSRYPKEKVLLDEAQQVFPNTILADELMVVDV